MTTEVSTKLNGTSMGRAEDQLTRLSNQAGKKVGEYASDFASVANEKMQIGREYVKENPAKGIAIAAATGIVIGSLMTMAFRRNS